MRFLIYILFVLLLCSFMPQQYTLLHINSTWNSRNDYKDLNKLEGVKIVKANLEDQSPSIRQQIKSVPVIFIYKGNSLIGRWDADISLKIKAPIEELQEVINSSKYTRVATN